MGPSGDSTNFMSLEPFSRLSQAIKAAAESVDPEVAKAHAVVSVNSIGVQSTPKRTARPTAFSEAADFLGDAIKAARETKLVRARDNKGTDAEKPEAAKSLAQLLVEAQDNE
jgi:hypothetical protein